MNTKTLFLIGVILSFIGALVLYVFEIEFKDSTLLLVQSVFYLAGLATLFFGWRLIDHKFPGRGERK